MKDKEFKTTQEEVLQFLVDVGIELLPSDRTLGEEILSMAMQEMLEDDYENLRCLAEEIYARVKNPDKRSNYAQLQSVPFTELCDRAIEILTKIKQLAE